MFVLSRITFAQLIIKRKPREIISVYLSYGSNLNNIGALELLRFLKKWSKEAMLVSLSCAEGGCDAIAARRQDETGARAPPSGTWRIYKHEQRTGPDAAGYGTDAEYDLALRCIMWLSLCGAME